MKICDNSLLTVITNQIPNIAFNIVKIIRTVPKVSYKMKFDEKQIDTTMFEVMPKK